MKKTVKNLITWSPSHLITSPKAAFTLAEVLITLAIIGVVAAMTIPTLVVEYKKKQWVSGLQKAIYVLNNGTKLMMADEGVFQYDQLAVHQCSRNDISCAEKYYSKYFKIVESVNTKPRADFYNPLKILFLNGGSIGAFGNQGAQMTTSVLGSGYAFKTSDGMIFFVSSGFVDVNGNLPPNQFGRDILRLEVNENGGWDVIGAGGAWKEETLQAYKCETNGIFGNVCSGRIKDEGWKMNY